MFKWHPIVPQEHIDRSLAHYSKSWEQRGLKQFARRQYERLTEGVSGAKTNEYGMLNHQLVLGMPGTGKTTLAKQLMQTDEYKGRVVPVDNDDIRNAIPVYKATLNRALNSGLNYADANSEAFKRCSPATQYVAGTVVNMAVADNRSIMWLNSFGQGITRSLLAPEQHRDFTISTHIIHAPETVLRESIRRRVEAGGHPSGEAYINTARDWLVTDFIQAAWSSKQQWIYFRPEVDVPPILVAKVDPHPRYPNWGETTIIDMLALSAMRRDLVENWGVTRKEFRKFISLGVKKLNFT